MSVSFNSGSETLRDREILQNWYTFQPISNELYALSGGVYSTYLGYNLPAILTINSGAVESSSGYINIEKIKYVFEDQIDADKFINDIGVNNIVAYYEQAQINPGAPRTILYVVEVINFPIFSLEAVMTNFESNKGYRAQVLKQIDVNGSLSKTEELDRQIELDPHTGILTEPFILYFDLEKNDD